MSDSGFDEAIDALVCYANADQHTRQWLRSLLRASHLILSQVDLPEVLHSIVTAAKDLVDARYAALGVLGPHGEVEEFVHTGIDPEHLARIGSPPQGRGILGLLISEPRPLRLTDLTQHPSAAGFPPGHPPMRSFLGVPILVRDRAFGNLYLADKAGGGEFTAEDEQLVLALAGFAAAAVDNAHRHTEARQREAWQRASVEITAALLAGTNTGEVLRLIADQARTVAAADFAAVVLPAEQQGMLTVRAVAGDAQDLDERTLPLEGSLCGLAMATGEHMLSDNIATDHRSHTAAWTAALGPGMVVPLATPDQQPTGALLVANTPGQRRFDRRDLQMLAAFGAQAALAQRLADHRTQTEELHLLEERDRIARDLHDHVIQEVFAAGLSLHTVAATATADQRRRLMDTVRKLDQVVSDIRATIFSLQSDPEETSPGLRRRLTQVIHDATDPLGFTPALRFDGPLDTLVPDTIAADLTAVVREALSNTARHAHATNVTVEVTANPDSVTARIEDNGKGIGDTTRRSGLANLRARARNHGGDLTIDSTPGEGTSLTWTAHLPR